jgi:hypothetical protein
MVGFKNKETIVIKQKDAADITVKLAEYLEILGSSIRLDILKLLMTEPLDVESISHLLCKKFGKISSRENTKNHIDKLLTIGLVIKQPGMRDSRAVVKYALVPGSIEVAMRTLSKVMKMDLKLELSKNVAGIREKLSEEFSQSFATIKILGGVDDGQEFLLKENEVRIGRVDPENMEKYDPKNDIALSDSYGAITRVWKPHAKLILEDGQWYIEHCEGVNETYLWDRKLEKNRKEPLKNGDVIGLAEGAKGVRMVFLLPKTTQAP